MTARAPGTTREVEPTGDVSKMNPAELRTLCASLSRRLAAAQAAVTRLRAEAVQTGAALTTLAQAMSLPIEPSTSSSPNGPPTEEVT